ncbi:hypothetical protein LSTR_LSTR005324 [Laodelphax striatellus]|uniref:Uncharacterized protein n=1 Tax=Laodelphax striatellus TaxID=195883 RepID=A0A482X846_LAOST|nr:hypothetical protein LSTR_LSTR005324 [Laodelphax striatellus]
MSSEEETGADEPRRASRGVSPTGSHCSQASSGSGSSSSSSSSAAVAAAAAMLRADSGAAAAVKQSASAADVRGSSSSSSTRAHLHAPGSDNDDSDSEPDNADPDHFLSKGAFLLTPSHELNMEKASAICEKMNFKGLYSLTKTATGILFKFAEPDDYQATFKKGFHKVTGARFYKKIPIPCRPQKTFVVFVLDVPEEVPEEDIRHSLYKFQSIVEVARLYTSTSGGIVTSPSGSSIPQLISGNTSQPEKRGGKDIQGDKGSELTNPGGPPPIIRVTLASLEECNILLQNGLDFYGATFFPTEPAAGFGLGRSAGRKSITNNSRLIDAMTAASHRVRDVLPVFDAAGFSKIPPPSTKTVKPR